MRIISGIAGGIRLRAPAGRTVRPTSDRVKESLFASLGDLTACCVVDLFSGTGALGLEALSRGAASVAFVERDRRHIRVIEHNLGAVLKCFVHLPVQPETRVIAADALRVPGVLADWTGAVDILLADPPYTQRAGEYGIRELLTDTPLAEWASGALLVLEHATDAPCPWHPEGQWHLVRQRRYGTTTISFARVQ